MHIAFPFKLRSESRLLAESASLLSLTGFLRHCHRSYVPVAPIRLLPLFDRLTYCQSARFQFPVRTRPDGQSERQDLNLRLRVARAVRRSSKLSFVPRRSPDIVLDLRMISKRPVCLPRLPRGTRVTSVPRGRASPGESGRQDSNLHRRGEIEEPRLLFLLDVVELRSEMRFLDKR